MCPLVHTASSRPPFARSPSPASMGRNMNNNSNLSNTSSIPMANFSAGRKTLNSSQEFEIPRKKTYTQPITIRSETPTRRGKWEGPKANDESQPPAQRFMRKRPTSASYENRNVVVAPPNDQVLNRRKVLTPTRERSSIRTTHESGGSLHESLSLKSILAQEPASTSEVSEDHRRGRKASPMSLRSSFEGGSFANVKAEASKDLLPSTNYWRVLNSTTIELKPRGRPQSAQRTDSVAGLLKWD